MKTQILLLFTCFSLLTNAQELKHCGTDEMHQHLFETRPDLNPGIVRANQRLQAFTQQYVANPPKSAALYVIPVVFHVIHNNGVENISDAQIKDAMVQLNLQYRKLNPDTNEIVAAFQGIAADPQIEFRLAQLDPNGNCTSGITRTVSTLTYIGDHQVKSLVHWPPEKYLNVYVCVEAAGLAGHALLPSAADTIPEWDGIVMQHDYIGTIGTSDYFRRTVLSHEVGHFLNLQHIWGGNNVPGYYYLPVGDAGNCAFDDDVTDTPNTIGWSTCNLNATSCSSLDNVQNYMDYAYCARMFTEGQKLRMHAALNSTVANRNNLWQAANLIATGTNDGNLILCAANFSSDKKVVCVGDSVHFSDDSYHGVTARLWNFENGTASSLSNQLTSVMYTTPGTYDVYLQASNGTDTVELIVPDYITVLPATGQEIGLTEGFEDGMPAVLDRWLMRDVGQVYNWEMANVGFNSNHSLMYNNLDAGANQVVELYTEPMDFSSLSSLAIAFDWAYGQVNPSDNCLLRVQVSTNCGTTWSTRKTYIGNSSLNSIDDTLATPFVPALSSDWNSDTVFVNTASVLTDHTMVKFRFEGEGGNNFYIDNIRLGDVNTLALNEDESLRFHIQPNPSVSEVQLSWSPLANIQHIEIVDVSNKMMLQTAVSANQYSLQLSVDALAAGMYFVLFHGNGTTWSQKMIVRE